jgi:hypothetical protein
MRAEVVVRIFIIFFAFCSGACAATADDQSAWGANWKPNAVRAAMAFALAITMLFI